MNKIELLDAKIYNRISAGEVVERPSSIVKELVENAIDAGATKISISIENGGIRKIKVSDNGSGIQKDDLQLAFLPHATSKIKSADDLNAISTLGFRGEALASIAAVSQVSILSKTADAQEGAYLEIDGGKFGEISSAASTNGTTMIVSNLFFNTPARAKFLKKPFMEANAITDLVSRLILANPSIDFDYHSDFEDVFLSNQGNLLGAIFSVYGNEISQHVAKVDYKSDGISITGYIGKPEISKPNRTYQTLIVNGRYVVNYYISSAIQSVYEDYLMKNKYPVYIINLTLPFDEIDVNVHPSKIEVKFENQSKIYGMFVNAVKQALDNSNFSISGNSIIGNKYDNETIAQEKISINLDNIKALDNEGISFSKKDDNFLLDNNKSNDFVNSSTVFEDKYSSLAELIIKSANTLDVKQNDNIIKLDTSEPLQTQIAENFSTKKTLGVLFDTYIVINDSENVYFIDQHAAHERINYDKITKELNANKITSQDLLIPYMFSVSRNEAEFIEENINVFSEIGFDICKVGEQSFRIDSVPFILANINLKEYFDYILKDLSALIKKPLQFIKERFTQMACKASVKGGNKLSQSEIDFLLNSLSGTQTLLCPHGRPIVIKFSKTDIEKWFKRIV